MGRALFALLCILGLLGLCACESAAPAVSSGSGTFSAPAVSSSAASSSAVSSASEPPAKQERAEALVSSLTLEEKVGQLFFARCPADSAAEDAGTYHLGGYLLFGRDFQNLTANETIQTLHAYQEAAKSDTGIPLLLGTDEEGGTVVRVSSNPNLCKSKFRSPQQLLADGGVEELLGETHEKDVLLRALGVNVNFAPVCDVPSDPSDFIYARSFGLGAKNAAACAADVVGVMNDDGMGSVLKHFPGYGDNADTHTGAAVDVRPMETFDASDFLPFRAGIAASDGQTAVLVCHNIVNCMDSSLPASLSPKVHAILREQLGFTGVAMTDDLAMDAVKAYAREGSAAVLALQAGNDMVLTTDYRAQIPQVLAAVKNGTLSESAVDSACVRVLLWKMALGLI